jgi:hypothetical protein
MTTRLPPRTFPIHHLIARFDVHLFLVANLDACARVRQYAFAELVPQSMPRLDFRAKNKARVKQARCFRSASKRCRICNVSEQRGVTRDTKEPDALSTTQKMWSRYHHPTFQLANKSIKLCALSDRCRSLFKRGDACDRGTNLGGVLQPKTTRTARRRLHGQRMRSSA